MENVVNVSQVYVYEAREYGNGYLVLIRDSGKGSCRVQIPGKYLSTLTMPSDVTDMPRDIKLGQSPFLIYGEQLVSM